MPNACETAVRLTPCVPGYSAGIALYKYKHMLRVPRIKPLHAYACVECDWKVPSHPTKFLLVTATVITCLCLGPLLFPFSCVSFTIHKSSPLCKLLPLMFDPTSVLDLAETIWLVNSGYHAANPLPALCIWGSSAADLSRNL